MLKEELYWKLTCLLVLLFLRGLTVTHAMTGGMVPGSFHQPVRQKAIYIIIIILTRTLLILFEIKKRLD